MGNSKSKTSENTEPAQGAEDGGVAKEHKVEELKSEPATEKAVDPPAKVCCTCVVVREWVLLML